MKAFINRLYLASHEPEYESLGDALKDKTLEIINQAIVIGGTFFLINFIVSYLPAEYNQLVSYVLGLLLGAWLVVLILKMMVTVILAEAIETLWIWANRNEESSR